MQVLEYGIWFLIIAVKALMRITAALWRGLVGLVRWWLRRRSRVSRRSGSHGTARFATTWEILKSGILFGEGPILGKGRFGRLIRFTTDGLVMVFAATGAGKGLGIVVPTLLDYRGSMFVTDPKGENYDITQRRRRAFGKVFMLSPTNLGASDRFNPLSIIRVGTPMEGDDAGVLARYMHRPDANEAHWDDRAVSLLTALILHVVHGPADLRTLSRVRVLSVGGGETFLDTLRDIARASPSTKAREIASGFLATVSKSDRGMGELPSVLNNVQKATEVWSAGSPGGIVSASSTFALDELITGTATLYLCVDEEYLEVYERWLRVMTGCMLSTVMRAKQLGRPKRKLVLMLDEVAALGPLDVIEKNSGLLRAYCTPVLIWQSMVQATRVYGRDRAEAFLSNASARVFFGVGDNRTASEVATLLGNATVLSTSEGVSQPSDAWLRQNHSNTRSEGGYWLLDPSEVQRLPLKSVIIKLRTMRFPILTRRLDYRWRLRWWGRYDSWPQPRPPAPDLPPSSSPQAPTPLEQVATAIPRFRGRPPNTRDQGTRP